jgi:teichoic acid transport system ATP-binding protein
VQAGDVHAVQGASFAVYEGESVAIRLEQRQGTILAAIAGLLPVTNGQIYAAYEPRLMGVGAALLPRVRHPQHSHRLRPLGMSLEQIDEHMDSIIEFADRRCDQPSLRSYRRA